MATSRELLFLCGSLRSGSTNAALLRTARELAPAPFSGHIYDGLNKLPHFNPDDDHEPLDAAVVDLRERIADAAAILICTPEYAGALPGSFKNLLDWTVGGTEIGEKPTAWINVSASVTHAADAHASLRTVLRYTGAAVVEDACVHIPVEKSMLDEHGTIAVGEVRERIAHALAVLTSRAADSRSS